MSADREGVELLTPSGAGGVAVLRVRGPRPLARLQELSGVGLPGPGEVRLGILREPGAEVGDPPLDEALLVGRGGWVEVHTHGSPAIVSAVTDHLSPARIGGVAPARAAASLEERAELAAASAPTAPGARVLLDQAAGALRGELTLLLDTDSIERGRRLSELAAEGRRCARLWSPTVVAIVGPVNAGKSTLFNVLLGEDHATVTARPGTTRDALGVPGELAGWPVLLVDTAGERDLASKVAGGDEGAAVEAEGQRLAKGVASRAELVLELAPEASGDPAESSPPEPGSSRRLRLQSRAAERGGADPAGWGSHAISALEDPVHARAKIEALFREQMGLGRRPPWIAGQAVPFESDLVERLCDLATRETVERSALASLLASI